jgi:hypothetical protein
MSYLDSRQAARRRRRPWRRWPLDATGLRQARGVALSQGLVGGGPWAQPARLLGGRGGISLGPVRRPAQGIGVPGGGGGGKPATVGCGGKNARHTFCEGDSWRTDLVAVAYRSWVLNQTDAKTLVANLTLGVAICGHEPNNP